MADDEVVELLREEIEEYRQVLRECAVPLEVLYAQIERGICKELSPALQLIITNAVLLVRQSLLKR